MPKSVELAKKKTEREKHQTGSNAGQVVAFSAVAAISVLGISWLIANRSLL